MRIIFFIFLCVYLLAAHSDEIHYVQAESTVTETVGDSIPSGTTELNSDQNQPTHLPPIQFRNNSKIVVGLGAKEIGKLLAAEIKKSLGWSFKVVKNIPANGQYIQLRLDCDNLPRDGFTYTSETERAITLCASEINGLKFAVFDFIESQLGVRWLFPAPNNLGTYRPKINTLIVSRENRSHAPAYINRRFSQGKVDRHYAVWAEQMRMTTSRSAFHHNLYNLFPPSEYRLTRPAFYPVHKNGIRYPEEQYIGACKQDRSLCKEENHHWQPVLTANGITAEAVENIRRYLDEHVDRDWYSLGMNDSLLWGEEQQDGKPLNSLGYVNLSDYFFKWVNEVAAKVGETHPRARFGLLAYHNLIDPPTYNLDDRVVPYITYDRMQWAAPDRRQADRARTETWSKRTHDLGWYDYVYGDQNNMYAVPRVYPRLMADYLRFGRDQGVRHYYAEAYPSSELWSEGPKLYLLAKLLWNPDLNVNELLLDWYRAAVGEGSIYLSNYFSRWESFWTERVPETQWFKSRKGDYLDFKNKEYLFALTAEDKAYLQEQMDRLKSSTRGTQFEERADFFIKAWNTVNSQAFGARFEFMNGVIPAEYVPVFEDSIEGTDGEKPAAWRFWNRPDVGSKVIKSSLTTDQATEGNKSFAIRIETAGNKEAYAVFFRPNAMSSHTTYCLKARVLSPGNTHTLSLTFKRDGENTQTHKLEQNNPKKNGWQTSALCTKVPANDGLAEVTAWLGIKSAKAGHFEAWFDDVGLYSKP